MSIANEIGDQDLSGEPASPPPGTGHVGKAIITPHGKPETVPVPAGAKTAAEVAGTDADAGAPGIAGTTDAARP
ncbi:hypothetical protein [Limnoglobus roseus]|uniref:Uncharacterized protein n=1 Tax=Limnoglobus roseus TaxID=2598579 RepID=A0A5C1A7Q6_9BACT|nr:hypothetical protein [Limnoglobus roseus]QEL14257.1 hypothetical protein PX52LOC_01127 [Limnoglobus roseus]